MRSRFSVKLSLVRHESESRPDETQLDGEGAQACPEAQEWFDGLRIHCVKIEAGQHFRNGKIDVRHHICKGMTRAMLDRAGMHIGWWYCAIRHAVLVKNLVEGYNQSAKLFRKRYASQRIGDGAEDLDLMTLQDVLIMGKEYGNARADWGRT